MDGDVQDGSPAPAASGARFPGSALAGPTRRLVPVGEPKGGDEVAAAVGTLSAHVQAVAAVEVQFSRWKHRMGQRF